MTHSRALALSALLAILALHLLWHGWLAPTPALPRWLPIALAWLPALPALIAWARGSGMAPMWAGLACLFYFSHGVMEAWSAPEARLLAWLEIALALTCILAASWAALLARFAGKPAPGRNP